jgi:hypothetical protein
MVNVHGNTCGDVLMGSSEIDHEDLDTRGSFVCFVRLCSPVEMCACASLPG